MGLLTRERYDPGTHMHTVRRIWLSIVGALF